MYKRKRFRQMFFLIFVFTVSIAVIGFATEATQLPKDILVFGSVDSITTWDPSAAYSTEATYMPNIYETLLRVTPPGSAERFQPVLAKSWEVSEDGLTWKFHLRKGVKFHDGEQFNAKAVKYSIERTKELGLGAAFIFDPVKEIKVLEEYVVQFTLKSAVPLKRILASANAAWIMSPKSAKKGREWFEEGHEAGTGPYKLESWKPDEEITFTRFDDYWKGWAGPHFNKVIVKIVKEATVMQQMLEAGEADLVSRIPTESIEDVDAREDCEVLRGPSFMNYAIHLNTVKPPLNNTLVRRAISYAIPYQDIIKVSVAGWGRQAVGPIPYGQFGHDESLYQYHHDLDKARDLLAEAGYPNGIDRTLVLTYAAENKVEERFTPLIKEELAKIGIDVEIRPMMWTSQWEWGKGDPKKAQDMFVLLWWPTFSDPYETMYSLWHTEEKPYWNLSYWSNEEFDQLILNAYHTSGLDLEEAQGLYSIAQQIQMMEAPSVFLFDLERGVYKRANLKGYIINPAYPRVPFFYHMYKE